MEELTKSISQAVNSRGLIEYIWVTEKNIALEFLADFMAMARSNADKNDDWTMEATLRIEKYYEVLPNDLKKIIDNGEIYRYDILLDWKE